MGLYIAMCMEMSKGSRRELEMFLPLAWVVQICVCHVKLCYVVLETRGILWGSKDASMRVHVCVGVCDSMCKIACRHICVCDSRSVVRKNVQKKKRVENRKKRKEMKRRKEKQGRFVTSQCTQPVLCYLSSLLRKGTICLRKRQLQGQMKHRDYILLRVTSLVINR